MHKDIDFSIKNVSKIEGHTHLDLKVCDGKVVECRLKISQNKRFFTQAVVGKDYKVVPPTLSRICGTCSSAHALCSIEAIEKAFDLQISDQTFVLRNLVINAGHLRDHAMHLYFFCLPDIFGKESVLQFTGKEKNWIHDGLHVKEAGNFLGTIVGGRAIHPPTPVVGGFTKFPSKKGMKDAVGKLEDCRGRILKIIDIFYKDQTSFKRKTNYVSLINPDYNYLKGMIKTAHGTVIPEDRYGEHLERVVLPYSTATGFKWESNDYMVGALARMNLNRKNMNEQTLRDVKDYLKIFPCDCVFNNNLAQAIEMLHEVDASLKILEEWSGKIKPESIVKARPRKSAGVGVIEAPRGTLYHKLELNSNGVVSFADLCIPTQQNIIHLEKDISKYVEQLLRQGHKKEKISLEVEQMIRAYDPCMSCATHFLKINWL